MLNSVLGNMQNKTQKFDIRQRTGAALERISLFALLYILVMYTQHQREGLDQIYSHSVNMNKENTN